MSLQVQDLVKDFGGVRAVNGVTFMVDPGECVALIGPNGAGKSTTFACIAGQHWLTGGQVLWNGERVDSLLPARRLQHGIARTFQVAQAFEALTVLQNVQLLTQYPRGLQAYNILENCSIGSSMALLEQVGLQGLAHADAQSLPYGAKKRLELAMALAGQNTGLLLLDEPAAGLAAPERVQLMALVKSLTQPRAERAGMAVLYTEHNMDAVFGVADRVLVLIDGVVAAQGTPDEIASDPIVRQRYLGQWWQRPLDA